MMSIIALTWARHRWELLAVALATVAATGVAVWVALGYAAANEQGCNGPGLPSAECIEQLMALNGLIPLLQVAATAVPPLAGVLLGVGLVAREIELGTAVLAWSYAPSRVGWLLPRMGLLLLPLVLLTLVMGLSIDAVYAAALPAVPIEHNLQDIHLRGWLPAGRAALAFAGALTVGAIVGRQLPAVLAALITGGLLVAGSMGVTELLARSDPVVEPGPGGLITDSLFQTDDGRILSEEEAVAELPAPDADFWAHYTAVHMGIPGSRAPAVVAASIALTSAVAALLLGMAAAIVERRRPY